MDSMTEFFGEPISVYTREDALADGVLVDVTETAREAGFGIPVAVTRQVWVDIAGDTPEDSEDAASRPDWTGRLWDVLWMARAAALNHPADYMVFFELLMQVGRKKKYQLKMMIGGEAPDGGPALTIMLPSED